MRKETWTYIPNPQRCFQCQKFGHTMNSCKGTTVCAGCGEVGHNLDDGQNEPKCVNCQGDHVAISRDCPKWKINREIHFDPQIYRKDFIRRCSQTFTTLFQPIKGFICNCNTDPSSIFKTSSTLGQKMRLPIDFKTEIEYLKYILNYCLTGLDTLDEITSENPVPRDAPSSDETPLHHKLPQNNKKNEITIPNTESALPSAASNDIINDENEIRMLTMSNKITFNEDNSDEDTINPYPAKKAATSSPASEPSGTRVPKGRGGGDLPEIYSRGWGFRQEDKSPARAPRFSSNTGEGSASSAQGGRNRGAIKRHPPLKPLGTIKTATKDKNKSKEKMHLHKSWLTTT